MAKIECRIHGARLHLLLIATCGGTATVIHDGKEVDLLIVDRKALAQRDGASDQDIRKWTGGR